MSAAVFLTSSAVTLVRFVEPEYADREKRPNRSATDDDRCHAFVGGHVVPHCATVQRRSRAEHHGYCCLQGIFHCLAAGR